MLEEKLINIPLIDLEIEKIENSSRYTKSYSKYQQILQLNNHNLSENLSEKSH